MISASPGPTHGPSRLADTLWAMFGVFPAGKTQLAHRNQSVAVELIVDWPPGCYTLLGDRTGSRDVPDRRPVRVDWEPAGAFVTPANGTRTTTRPTLTPTWSRARTPAFTPTCAPSTSASPPRPDQARPQSTTARSAPKRVGRRPASGLDVP